MQQYRSNISRHATAPRRRAAAALSLLVLAVGCQRTSPAPPVAALTVAAAKSRVTIGGPADLTFKFDVAPGAAIEGNYKVFVHALAPDGHVLWNDDHDPSVPTSQWKPGQTIQYSRTVFVPPLTRAETATIEAGLYRDSERLPLQTGEATEREIAARGYKVLTLQLAPQTEGIFLIYKSGWYSQEFSSTDPATAWTWSGKSAVIAFKNPHTDVTLLIESTTRLDAFKGTPQQVSIFANGQPVGSFESDSATPSLRRLPIPAAALGAGDTAEIRLDVDRTFRPSLMGGGGDNRDLGLRVYHLFLESR